VNAAEKTEKEQGELNTILCVVRHNGNRSVLGRQLANPENYLYVAGANDPITVYQASSITGSFNTVGAIEKLPLKFSFPGPIPWSHGMDSDPSTALLWAIDASGFGVWHPLSNSAAAAKPATLFVYNAIPGPASNPVLSELWKSSTGTANLDLAQ